METPLEVKAGRVWPLLIGTAAGATLGVLFAPGPGAASRRRLALWLKERRRQGRARAQAHKRKETEISFVEV